MDGFNNSSLCETAHRILDPIHFRITLAVESVTAVVAVIANALLLSIVHKVVIFPPNLRLLLGYLSFIFVWYSIGSIIKSLYFFTVPICKFKMTIFQCKLMELFCIAAVVPGLFYTVMALSIERLYATMRYKKYDKTAAKKPFVSILMIIFSFACSFGIHGSLLANASFDEHVPICDISFIPVHSEIIYEIYLALELLAVGLNAFVFWYNRMIMRNMAINRAQYDLSSRFQIDQNMRINLVMVPSVLLHVLCHIPMFAVVIFVRGDYGISLELRSWLTQVTLVWRLIYAVIHPILAFRYNDNFRYHLKNSSIGLLFKTRGETNRADDAADAAGKRHIMHFNFLEEQWGKTKQQDQRERKGTNKIGAIQ